jgi:aminoglycoside phosphotransferase family enzyme/predicted kinase
MHHGRMADPNDPLAAGRARVEALRAAFQGREAAPVRLIETHISWVLLAGDSAYKLKKPVRLPFLDFTTLAARRHACEEELRLNRRLAPGLYLDVVELRDGPSGPCFGGPGALLDVAVHMRRFPDGALWSERLAAATLTAAEVDAFARRLCAFHRDASVAAADSNFGSAAVHERVIGRLVAGIDAWQAGLPRADPAWPPLRTWLRDELARLAPFWPMRLATGRVREGHGDLHLANVLQLGDEATAFDGIEFDPELRWIDVLDDQAFPVMDLLAHGRRDLAFRFLDACLQAGGDYDGLPGLRFFLVLRALVRAQVAVLVEARGDSAAAPCGAADYLRLASTLSRDGAARLAITHGLPGSGKTFVSQRVLESVGAIRVRSDVERKRLFGLDPREASRGRLVEGIYGTEATAATYARLLAVAHGALRAGWPTIVDAAFLRRHERAAFAALAVAVAAPFSIIDCRAPMPLLRRRVAARRARGDDASEADLDVLERLAASAEPLEDDEMGRAIAAVGEPVAFARDWLAAA